MDKIPGDPDVVRDQAQTMVNASRMMKDAADRLMQLTDDTDFSSDATDQLRRNAGDLAASMTQASIRYRGAGQALGAFSAQLRVLQADADVALAAYGQTDVSGAAHLHTGAEIEAVAAAGNPFMPDDERQHIARQLHQAQQVLEQERIRANAATSQWESAHTKWDAAAKAAANVIRDADDASRLNEGAIQHFLNWVDDHLQDIHDIIDAVGTILAVISIALIATGVGAPLGIIGITALVALLAVENLGITAIQYSEGKKSMSDLIFEGAFAILSVVGLGSAIAAAKGAGAKDLGEGLVKAGAKAIGKTDLKDALVKRLTAAPEAMFEGVTWAEGKWGDSALSEASAAAPSNSFWTAADERPAVAPNEAAFEVTKAFAGFDRSPFVQIQRSELRLAA